jgi:hypothetical protein
VRPKKFCLDSGLDEAIDDRRPELALHATGADVHLGIGFGILRCGRRAAAPMVVGVNVEHDEVSEALCQVVEKDSELMVEAIVQRVCALDDVIRWRLVPNAQSPRVLGPGVNGTVARAIEIDLEARAQSDDAHVARACPELRIRILFPQPRRLVQREHGSEVGADTVSRVKRYAYDRTDRLLVDCGDAAHHAVTSRVARAARLTRSAVTLHDAHRFASTAVLALQKDGLTPSRSSRVPVRASSGDNRDFVSH